MYVIGGIIEYVYMCRYCIICSYIICKYNRLGYIL